MEAAFTVDIHDTSGEDLFMVTGTRSEWEQLMGNLDGIGHAPATLELLAELKRWGLQKNKRCY